MTPAELEQRIDEKIAVVRMSGWQVIDCVYFVPSMMTCCALSACVLDELIANNEESDPLKRTDSGSVICRILGISYTERYSFIAGFDGARSHSTQHADFYDLGVRMRAKYIETK